MSSVNISQSIAQSYLWQFTIQIGSFLAIFYKWQPLAMGVFLFSKVSVDIWHFRVFVF